MPAWLQNDDDQIVIFIYFFKIQAEELQHHTCS